jgi:hypothetical protein
MTHADPQSSGAQTHPVEIVDMAELKRRLDAQKLPKLDVAFVCPMCRTVQSERDFVAAGIALDKIEKYLGYSCIGRWTGGTSPRVEPDGKPCDWTLGGLFSLHRFAVETKIAGAESKLYPCFEPATPEQAQAHAGNDVPA